MENILSRLVLYSIHHQKNFHMAKGLGLLRCIGPKSLVRFQTRKLCTFIAFFQDACCLLKAFWNLLTHPNSEGRSIEGSGRGVNMRNYYCVIASRSVPHFVNDFYVRKCAYKHSSIITLTQGFTPSTT